MPAVLKQGSGGSEVVTLQKLLNAKLQPSPQLATDGAFGAKTVAAVKAYQKQQQLQSDGIVGPKTWAKLNASKGKAVPTADALLQQAKAAVAHTKATLSLGNINKNFIANTIKAKGENLLNHAVQKVVHSMNGDLGGGQKVQMISDVATAAKVGNCMECAAVAATYLRDQGVSPVEYMGIYEKGGAGKHAFVVLGRELGSNAYAVPNPKDWKGPVVICDPWEGTAFPLGSRPIFGLPGELVAHCRW
ncbi:peptidoglycan-binding protein [Anatilimnocola sp. NA78]|uniref:peptidoglycan-binding domain-containing protein n=1 Tax=Anatilimnocola sp. NA78 TaxID=3415683 RepID=UPI003CE534FF